MSITTNVLPLTLADLAARWQISEKALRRRLPTLGLPGVNVGTATQPEWRFRVEAVQRWEAANERPVSAPEGEATTPEPVPVPPAMPSSWDGKRRLPSSGRRRK